MADFQLHQQASALSETEAELLKVELGHVHQLVATISSSSPRLDRCAPNIPSGINGCGINHIRIGDSQQSLVGMASYSSGAVIKQLLASELKCMQQTLDNLELRVELDTRDSGNLQSQLASASAPPLTNMASDYAGMPTGNLTHWGKATMYGLPL